MFDDENELRLYEDFLQSARLHPHSKAVDYIRELWEQKGTSISATRLYTLYQPKFQVYLDDDLLSLRMVMRCLHETEFPVLPVPCLDKHAIDEIGAFINNTRCDLAQARENHDYARIDADIECLERINECLANCLTQNGKVRFLEDVTRGHARLIWQSVKHLLDAIHPVHSELAEYIDAHIVIGAECYWSLNPHRSRG